MYAPNTHMQWHFLCRVFPPIPRKNVGFSSSIKVKQWCFKLEDGWNCTHKWRQSHAHVYPLIIQHKCASLELWEMIQEHGKPWSLWPSFRHKDFENKMMNFVLLLHRIVCSCSDNVQPNEAEAWSICHSLSKSLPSIEFFYAYMYKVKCMRTVIDDSMMTILDSALIFKRSVF